VEDSTLREGMKRVARWKKIVAVHAESEILTKQLSAERMARNQISVRDYLESRPVAAELDAIRRATDIAGETGCALHIVHVSSGAGIALVLEAQKRGVNVTCETCPHYLALTENDVEKLGAIAKCAPPLRSIEEQNRLWDFLKNGAINTIGSDHSPSPPEMKTRENFFKIWGGISSVQHTLPILISEAHIKRGIALTQIAKLISFNVAERFSLPKTKGQIAIGADADFSFVKMDEEFSVRKEELFYRHKQTPYLGKKLRGKIARTVLRGKTIFHNGKIASEVAGRLVKPTAA
jgi:allantoinase